MLSVIRRQQVSVKATAPLPRTDTKPRTRLAALIFGLSSRRCMALAERDFLLSPDDGDNDFFSLLIGR